jgi:predicted nucleic acid-binding protein
MSLVIVLDTFPLSSTAKVPRPNGGRRSPVDECQEWLDRCNIAGHRIVVPSICYYETVRELERRQAAVQILRLHEFSHAVPDRFISINDAHLGLASKLWAEARRAGVPTSSPESLDADVILAAQAILLGLPKSDYVIATTNVDHLSLFAPAVLWSDITP